MISASENRRPNGIIVEEISLLDLANFTSIAHVSRGANKVAHCIAQYALSHPSPFSWIESVFPSWILDVSLDLI